MLEPYYHNWTVSAHPSAVVLWSHCAFLSYDRVILGFLWLICVVFGPREMSTHIVYLLTQTCDSQLVVIFDVLIAVDVMACRRH